MTKTTNITESHWKVLKYEYIYTNNRLRLDKLVDLLAGVLVEDLTVTVSQMQNQRIAPSWWKQFTVGWKKCLEAGIDNTAGERYHIDLDKWLCSSPSFLKNPYFLCKHLVQACSVQVLEFPNYNSTYRRHEPPLLKFDGVSEVFRPVSARTCDALSAEMPLLQCSPLTNDDILPVVRLDPEVAAIDRLEPVQLVDPDSDAGRAVTLVRQLKDRAEFLYTTLTELLDRESDNLKFLERLAQHLAPTDKRIVECVEKLNGRRQQGTFGTGGCADLLR
ncbi:hypothetical protein R1flu_000151 [Riccia fluitans]|uniref:SWIM-type domain-containing protein n=1 Tax=Riccia fluitans TaxID=41844 RepID=A0ABD1XZM4_9MARC